ncbi:multifunctional CCA addition/repair protein [Simiduia agarivorans]|uniref:Multifunctional CCA protein n=1 Tax=Simiduia agarivorans (strain DSM 21679 / JCM 13881 / BCRC 17597 / SA1) TaxID=1117647 RepID=K4KM32_SIMAS|nr:multifunctional CCA addition/repair protein [Simiduia agarivorans]AFU99138.1 tRNA nucleotidyltransferase [Simiduia agarivorans SA1 = DSM 21679]
MQVYLVGGAVRDQLLGFPFHERDWVVVGATPEHMRAQGYEPVGKDFPVFLHPQTKEEYALARTERKSGPGYTGFTFHTDPSVTLEQDLIRRDLTINAMAQTPEGEIVDPYNGQADLHNKLLRHVSPAFAEDPVRILRIARFAARYSHLGFTVAPETNRLMKAMVDAGEVDHLVAERCWKELVRALAEPNPEVFVQVLRDCGALARIMPELDALWGVPQRPEYHPEVDTGVHTLLTLRQAVLLTPDGETRPRFAALVHDLGKGITPVDQLPRHINHENRGVPLVKAFCSRLGVPKEYRELAIVVCAQHLNCHRALELRPETVLKLFQTLDAFRRPERLPLFVQACMADARGRTGFEHCDYPPAEYLPAAYGAAAAVKAQALVAQGLNGPALGAAIAKARTSAIAEIKARFVAA